MNRRRTTGARQALGAALALSLLITSSAVVEATTSNVGPGLAAIRRATAPFQDVAAALAAGYIPVSPCEAIPGLGGMGFHYLNPALAADLSSSPLTPEILLYVPSGDGLRLVGVEYFSVALANTEAGPAPWFAAEPPPLGFFNDAPTVLDRSLDGPMPGHNPTMPWHYDLHAWIWQANPAGMFEPWNPNVTC